MNETAYSPRLRTAVVLTGSGTAGAYQSGALRAIAESGIRVDVIAAHGAGVLTALTSAIDAGARAWDPSTGPWTSGRLRQAYRWRPALRAAFVGLLACLVLLLTPLLVLVVAAVVYAAATLASLVSLTGVSVALVEWYSAVLLWLFEPSRMPTVVPRLLVLGVLVVAGVLVAAAWRAARQVPGRRAAGAFWWHLLSWPLDPTEPSATAFDLLWSLVQGAAGDGKPAAADLGRRYVDVLTDNFGEPGFHEVIVAVHDLDARRDVVGAVLAAPGRATLERERDGVVDREGEIVDFTGPQRETLAGFLSGAFRLPVVTAPSVVEYAHDGYWRGERHRLCDRPELAIRLVDEVAALGVEQIILISPAPPPAGPHQMGSAPPTLRARMGEAVRSFEAAALADATTAAMGRCPSVFVVRPDHNPIGPFDFGGVYDEASDRQRTIAELMQQGYADAYHHLIEPVVAASDPDVSGAFA